MLNLPSAGGAAHFRQPLQRSGSDASVQGTNDDAQVSKLSCANAGYFKDEFVKCFVRRPVRRSPLINRGYYARFAAIRRLLFEFLAKDPSTPKQVLSLGAGCDATWFNLAAEQRAPAKYVELDFPEVTRRKTASIFGHEQLRTLLQLSTDMPPSPKLVTGGYCLLPCDLRNLKSVEEALREAQVNFDVPTLIVAECVLVYIDPERSSELVGWLGSHFTQAAMLVYEQINPNDAFGRQMISNLESRGCPLKGIMSTPTLHAHKCRFLNNGWQQAMAVDMDTLYSKWLDAADRQRIERLEIFDEWEEWHLIQEHYCLAIGINDAAGFFTEFGFPQLSHDSSSIADA